MGSKDTDAPKFRGAVGGYNRTDVQDYVARKEAESEMRERRQNDLEKQCEDLKKKISGLNEELEAERVKNQEFIEEHESLKNEVEELKDKFKEANEERIVLKQELEELRVSVNASGADPKTIQTAILSAQRMSEILIEEANQKADEILKEAEAERLEHEEAGRQAVEAAEMEALRVTDEAEKKCDNLQQAYDRILLDVTKFKSELMDMYRRHMELLAALPEKDSTEPNQLGGFIDVEFLESDEA